MNNASTSATTFASVTPGSRTPTGNPDNMPEQEMVLAIAKIGNVKFIAKVRSGTISLPDAYRQVMADRGATEPKVQPQESPGAKAQTSENLTIDPEIRDGLPEPAKRIVQCKRRSG